MGIGCYAGITMMTVRVETNAARKILAEFLDAEYPDVAMVFRAARREFGPAAWLEFAGEGEDRLRERLKTAGQAIARGSLDAAKRATADNGRAGP